MAAGSIGGSGWTGHARISDASATSDPASIGMCASSRVPSPTGETTLSRPSSTCRRSISPRSPVPPATVAPPLPSSVTTTTTSPPSSNTRTVALRVSA